MVNFGGDLADRLYPRSRSEYADLALLDDLMREDVVVALVQFLCIGLERRDLQPDEFAEALELAEAGRLLKSSGYLREALREYQRTQPAS